MGSLSTPSALWVCVCVRACRSACGTLVTVSSSMATVLLPWQLTQNGVTTWTWRELSLQYSSVSRISSVNRTVLHHNTVILQYSSVSRINTLAYTTLAYRPKAVTRGARGCFWVFEHHPWKFQVKIWHTKTDLLLVTKFSKVTTGYPRYTIASLVVTNNGISVL